MYDVGEKSNKIFCVKKILYHTGLVLLLLSIPIVSSPDFDGTLSVFKVSPFQREFIRFVLVTIFFYLNLNVFLPKFYSKKRFLVFTIKAVKSADLEDFYAGEIYQSYFNKFSESLENEDYINTQLLSSLLLQFLFPKLDWFHKTHDWKENLYFVQGSFAINCQLNAEYFEDNEEIMETKITGRIDENCSLQEVLRGGRLEDEAEELVAGKIEIIYRTSKKTKQLISCDVITELIQDEEVLQKRNLKISI